jgi:transcriptional regulator with XRE-family HTH domain
MSVRETLGLSIGQRIKTFRKAKGLSLADLAGLTDISEATLSRVENAQTPISAHNLYILARVLGVDVTAFFADAASPIRSGVRSIARKGEGLAMEAERYSARVLCTDLSNKRMHPAINTVRVATLEEAGGLSSHPGEEFLYVIAGELALHSEFYAPLLLEEGDAIYFDGAMGHAYVNAGDAPARILVLTTTDQQEAP